MKDNTAFAGNKTFMEWQKKRRNTVIGYLIVGVIGGIDYSIVFATLYLYLKDLVKTNQPNLYYGLVIGGFSLSSTILGTFAGRWIDKKRRMRLYTNVILLMQLIGNLIYVIPFSPIYLIIGRLIAGAGDTFPSVASGEIVRIFDNERGTSVLWWLASAYSVGYAFGPVFGVVFKDVVHFKIGSVTVNYLNFPGVLMALLILIALVIVNFLLHDCSAEFDLKEYYRQEKQISDSNSNYQALANTNGPETINENSHSDQNDDVSIKVKSTTVSNESPKFHNDSDVDQEPGDLIDKTEPCSENEPLLKTNSGRRDVPISLLLKQFCRSFDIILLFLTSFIFAYCLFSLDVLLPLITTELLKWDLLALTIILSVYGVVYFIALIIFSMYVKTGTGVYNMCVICILLQIVAFGVIVLMKRAERNFTRDILLMVAFLICYIFVWFVEEVLLRSLVARMVPSNVQSFTEAMRNTFARAATVISAVTAPLALPYIDWFSIGLACLVCIVFVLFLLRHKSLRNIKEILINNVDRC